MKKRLLSLLLAAIMLISLLPVSAFAATKTVGEYFDGLPITANPGTGTTAWKVGAKDGQEVLMSGSKGKSSSTSTLTLTFTETAHLTFEYKVSSEANYDKCTIKLGTTVLVNGESGDQDWKPLELDVQQGNTLTVEYKKDFSGDKFDDCVYLRNFSTGTPLVVTLHANNGTEDTLQQKIYGGKGTLKANTFTCPGKIFAGWALTADGAVQYDDGAAITPEQDLDLYAVWADAYTVTFTDGNTSSTVLVPQNSSIGSRLPADPAKKGYVFSGWFSGDTQLTAQTVISGDVTYTASWTPITYTIAFSAGEGDGQMDSITATYDTELTLPKGTFTRAGYRFNGWATSSGSSYAVYQDEDTVKNLASEQDKTVTLYAAWKGLPVTVTVHPNYEGAENTTRTSIVGSNYNYILLDNGSSKFSSIEDPTRTGYIFSGWFDAPEGGTEITNQYKLTADDAANGLELYAHWTKGITVHFDGNGYKAALSDKTVTADKVSSSLPYLSNSSYPDQKALDGWYVKNEDGSFGEAVTKDSVFTGDEITLIAKWRDYQYIIRYNVKYADKNTTTGTMADQTAAFGQDVQLAPCAYSRTGYTFAGWAESSYGSTVKYADGAAINRPFEEGDGYWDDGSTDGEIYNLYAIWTEAKTPEQQEAEDRLNAAEAAISGNYHPTYGTDTNALTMIQARLTAAGITDVTVTMKEAAYSSWNYVGIAADGTLQYKWNSSGATPASAGSIRPTVVLTYQGSYTKESTECFFSMGLDEAKALAALNAVADRITLPDTVTASSDLTSLPKYPLKAGISESDADYNSGNSQELWTTASWTSGNPQILSITDSTSAIFAPYQATAVMPQKDTTVTLTLKLVYNGRDDLSVTKTYDVLFKGTSTARELDYQELLETTLRDIGLKNFTDGTPIDAANLTSDIQFPTTSDFRSIAARDYEKDFDGKYTPILLTTSDDSLVVSADPDLANVARMITYQPLPGQPAKTVTVSVKILSRPSGSGRDYASMPVLASKDIVLTVQPMQQSELDAAAAFMKKVCTEDVYWEGIRSANTDRSHVTGNMQSFVEIVPDGSGYRFIRDVRDYNMSGIKADDIPGWYDAQQYRCFRSSNSAVVAHETLLVTQPQYNSRITIDSVLTYTQYAKYYEKFRNDPAYQQFAQFYQQPVSTTVTVIGRDGENPDLLPMTVTVSVAGSSIQERFADLNTTYTCTPGEGRTAADALLDALAKNGYSYTGSAAYVSGVTDPNGITLAGGDSAYGSWSGWMFTVNGTAPILGYYESGSPIYATLNQYQLQRGDVVRFYYVACPTENGQHIWDSGKTTEATCTADGKITYTCTVCGDTKTEIIPAAGHSFGEPAWIWNDDFTAAAVFTCANDKTHVETVAAAVTSAVTTAATCTADGTRTYTAKVSFGGKDYTDTKTEVIPAAGHSFGEPVWVWNDDFTAAAVFTCANDKTHAKTVAAAVTSAVTTAATCTADGTRTYTAKVSFGGRDYTDTKTEVIPAAGHETHLVGAQDATCTDDGFTGDEVCQVCQTVVKQGEVIPALGHDYEDGICSRCGAEEPAAPVEPGKPEEPGTPSTPDKPTQPEQPAQPDAPTTGDAGIALWLMLPALSGAAALTLSLRRKRTH